MARQLSDITHLPVYHLDQYFWKPHWTHPDYEEYRIIHDELCDRDEWIIDGMNLRILGYRIICADMVIFLDIPRYICFWRIFKRLFQYYGTETPSSAPGCPEKLSWNFLIFLKWVWDFKKRYPQKINWWLEDFAGKKEIYVFKTQKEVDAFLSRFGKRYTSKEVAEKIEALVEEKWLFDAQNKELVQELKKALK